MDFTLFDTIVVSLDAASDECKCFQIFSPKISLSLGIAGFLTNYELLLNKQYCVILEPFM